MTPKPAQHRPQVRVPQARLPLLLLIWAAVYAASLFRPPLLDDADATHAQAAAAIARTGDWVTLHVNGVRYLEKAPLPYWLVAIADRVFGFNTFSAHLPGALAVLALALLARHWLRWSTRDGRAAGLAPDLAPDRTSGLAPDLAAAMVLTSVGTFLFTRIFIPDILLALLLLVALYAAQRALDRECAPAAGWRFAMLFWSAAALAVLTKGLVAVVFLAATLLVFLLVCDRTGLAGSHPAVRPSDDPAGHARCHPAALLPCHPPSQRRDLHFARRRLHPLAGIALFLAIAAPWHVLAGMRNPGGANGHGFFWFYFVNEHVLRFLGQRLPRDYNKLPWFLYWTMHLAWLFPWSAFLPVACSRRLWRQAVGGHAEQQAGRTRDTILLLGIFSTLVLGFFALSTNQEYYTLPVYAPLLMLLALPLAAAVSGKGAAYNSPRSQTPLRASFLLLGGVGLLAGAALAYGLWSARGLPAVHDIGPLLAHRDVGEYTLSTSHLFDLTGHSFAALRLPAALALVAFGFGLPAATWLALRSRVSHALAAVGATSAVFLVAAHLAFVRFAPLLSSRDFATDIQQLEASGRVSPGTRVLLLGDQAYGSSLGFYLAQPLTLVDGRTTSMWFGSTFADAPPVFWTAQDLQRAWGDTAGASPPGTSGAPPRMILAIPAERVADARRLLAKRPVYVLADTAGKLLVTNQPLPAAQ